MIEYFIMALIYVLIGWAMLAPHHKAYREKMKSQDRSAHRLRLKPQNDGVDYFILSLVVWVFSVLWPLFFLIMALSMIKRWRERES